MDWLHILEAVAPAALAFTPAAPFIPAVIAGVKLAQAKGGTGAEKKALAMDTAMKIAEGVDAVRAGTVDPATLSKVVSDGIETAVGVTKLVHKGPDAAKVVSTSLPDSEQAAPGPSPVTPPSE